MITAFASIPIASAFAELLVLLLGAELIILGMIRLTQGRIPLNP